MAEEVVVEERERRRGRRGNLQRGEERGRRPRAPVTVSLSLPQVQEHRLFLSSPPRFTPEVRLRLPQPSCAGEPCDPFHSVKSAPESERAACVTATNVCRTARPLPLYAMPSTLASAQLRLMGWDGQFFRENKAVLVFGYRWRRHLGEFDLCMPSSSAHNAPEQ